MLVTILLIEQLYVCVLRWGSPVEPNLCKERSACVITSVLLCVIQLSAENVSLSLVPPIHSWESATPLFCFDMRAFILCYE